MNKILIATGAGQDDALKTLVKETTWKDILVVEDWDLRRKAVALLVQLDVDKVVIIVSPTLVEDERQRVREKNAQQVLGRMTGAERGGRRTQLDTVPEITE